jgi:hypothetical protein
MNDAKEPDREPAAAAPKTSESIDIPDNKPAQGWSMPEPVFQQSTGHLPQGYQNKFTAAETPATAGATAAPAPQAEPPPQPLEISETPDITPQPNISEEFVFDEAVTPGVTPAAAAPVRSKGSGGGRVIFFVLAIIAIGLGAMAILAAIYYFYFYEQGSSQILN